MIRHVQLKSSHQDASTNSQKIHIALSGKQSGCVVWILFNDKDMSLGPFFFLGGDAGSPLPDLTLFKVAKHAKGNAQGVKTNRPALRVVPQSKFTRCVTVEDVYRRLFERPA